MSEKKVEVELEVVELPKDFYRSIGMPEPVKKIHEIDASQRIIQHYVHSYDEHGNVIVVEGDKEDLKQSIGQYQNEVGAKNIIRMIEAGGDPSILTTNKSRAFYGDVSEMSVQSINELPEVVGAANLKTQKALDAFNKTYNTSLDLQTFVKLYETGLLKDHIEGVTKKEDTSDVSK